MEKNLTSIIILNYNGKSFLENCINSIIQNTPEKHEIIIVDNNSPDNSGKLFLEKYPSCKFILNEKNVGVPEGLNIGIENAKGEFLVFLNNDLIVNDGWLKAFHSAYSKFGYGLYQPKSLKMENTKQIDGVGNMINLFGFGFSRGKGEPDIGKYDKEIEEISYASGTCMFLPKKIIDEIGKFDKILFAYHEEVDLGWRARLFGYRSYYVPQSLIHHFGSANWGWSKKKFYLLERNRWIVLLKNYSTKTVVKLLPSLFIIEIILLGFFIKKGLIKEKIHSYISILMSLEHIIKNRKIIQSKRKINDDELIEAFYSNIYIPPESQESQHTESFSKVLVNLSKLCGMSKKLKYLK